MFIFYRVMTSQDFLAKHASLLEYVKLFNPNERLHERVEDFFKLKVSHEDAEVFQNCFWFLWGDAGTGPIFQKNVERYLISLKQGKPSTIADNEEFGTMVYCLCRKGNQRIMDVSHALQEQLGERWIYGATHKVARC